MLASIKKNKFVRYFIILLSLLLFTSCTWFSSNDDDQISFTITGNLTTNGAMPQNYAQAMNARTALATAPSGQTIKYKFLLLAAEDDTEPVEGAVSEVASDGSSYSIKYTGSTDEAAQYYLRAVAYYMDGTNEVDVLLSPDTQLGSAVNLKNGTFSQDLEMRPATSGYGEVSLTITLDSATMCDSITISDDTHFEISGSGTSRKIIHKATSAENPKVACGSYPVTVSFYKNVSGFSSPFLVYQFEEVINVFNNLTTNTWVDNGNSPHLTTASGMTSCSITNSMLTDFKMTNFYVDNRLAAIGKGTFLNPFNSLYAAISYINATGDNTTSYTIHIKGDSSGSIKEWYTYTYVINKRITLETYIDVPGRKDGIIYFEQRDTDSGTLFDVQAGGVLTFDSNGEAAGISGSYATKGIMLKVNDTSVEVNSGGKFVMKGGLITATDSDNSEGRVYLHQPNAGAQTIFEMSGGAIEGFMCGGASGVYVENGATVRLHGKPYIYNNRSNVSLASGNKIVVDGPLKEGALIGVSASGTPTITSPITVTSGYGYQTGGYNAGVNPGKYFRSDNGDYGVTNDFMLETPAGEAALSPSGGNFSVGKLIDDLTFSIDKNFITKSDLEKNFSFTAKANVNGTITTIEAGSGTGKISYSTVKLTYHGETIPATSGSLSYYSLNSDKNQITLLNDLPAGKYTININAIYNGKTYQTDFDISLFDDLNTTTFSVSDAVTIVSKLTGEKTLKIKGSDITDLITAIQNRQGTSLRLTLDLSETTVTNVTNFRADNIITMILPDTLTAIDYTTQYPNGNHIESYIISDANPNFSTLDGVVYNRDKTQLILYPKNKTDTEFTLPSTVKSLYLGAFYLNSYLTKINGLSQIQTMGNIVFESAYKLEEADLSGLTDDSLHNYMFAHNPSLKKVILSGSISSFSLNVFDGCTGLTEIHFKSYTPPTLYRANDLPEFNNCNSELKFYIPTGARDAYLAATGTNGFANPEVNYFANSLASRIIEE